MRVIRGVLLLRGAILAGGAVVQTLRGSGVRLTFLAPRAPLLADSGCSRDFLPDAWEFETTSGT
jgi:hypothetical protein